MLPRPQLDPAKDLPLYRQLYDFIRESIEAGTLALGERLPPTRELAGQLGLNRTTVSAAYELLESEGLIRGHVGRGSFVNARPAKEPAFSFASSRPAADLFPLDDFRQACVDVLSGPEAAHVLQLGAPHGYAPLREYLLEQARAAGEAGPGDDVIIVSGCQQGLDLIRRTLVDASDAVAIEDPVYPGLRNAFSTARLIPLPNGIEGMDAEHVARALDRHRPSTAVLTPEFQNPTGLSLDRAARERILAAAQTAGTRIVENDIYRDLRYRGRANPTLKALDPDAPTLLLRSFSKIAFPGLRVGWIIGPREDIRRLAEAKRWCDLHTDQLSQSALFRFAATGKLAAHRARVQRAGADRLAAALRACEEALPQGARWTRPEGGLHLWVQLPGGTDAAEALSAAERAGASYLPGNYFGVATDHRSSLRLSFGGLRPEHIKRGIEILGAVFQQRLDRAPEPALV